MNINSNKPQRRSFRAVSLGGQYNNNYDQQNSQQQSSQQDISQINLQNKQKNKILSKKEELELRLWGFNNQINMASVQRVQDPKHLQPHRGLKAKIALENQQKAEQELEKQKLPQMNLNNQQLNQTNFNNTNFSNYNSITPQNHNNTQNISQLPPINNQINQNQTAKFQLQQKRSIRSFSQRPQPQKQNLKQIENLAVQQQLNQNNIDPLLNISEIQGNPNQLYTQQDDITQNEILIQQGQPQNLSNIQGKTFTNNLNTQNFSKLDASYLQQQKMLNYTHITTGKYIRKSHQQKLLADEQTAKPVRNLVQRLKGPIDIRYENLKNKKNDKFKTNQRIQDKEKVIKKPEEENVSTVNDIDTFISMVREQRLSPMEFIYLIKENPKSNDAYNMKVFRYDTLAKNEIVDYYTLSSKGVTRYENNNPIEFVHLGDWLKERDQFNMIRGLPFFQKFSKTKALKQWIKILHKKRSEKIKSELQKKLFILNPTYQQTLVKHKQLCYQFENIEFIEFEESNTSIDLQKFAEIQSQKRKKVVKDLENVSKQLHENCQKGINQIIMQLQEQIRNEMSHEEEQMQMNTPSDNVEIGNNIDEKKQILEKLGFPTNMNYGLRSQMRMEFQRFLRLAYLLDFICIQSLGNIYIGSAQQFLSKLKQVSSCTILENIIDNPEAQSQDQEPLFNVQFQMKQLQEIEQSDLDYDIEEKEFDAKVLNEEKCQVFDLQKHAYIVPNLTEEEKEEILIQQQGQNLNELELEQAQLQFEVQAEDDYEDGTIIKQRNVVNIHECWIDVQPNIQDVQTEIENIFSEGLDCIQVIERWSKNQMFLPYAKGLEEWDEIIGGKWNMPEAYYLNPTHLFNKDKDLGYQKQFFEQETFFKEVFEIIDNQFNRLDRFKEELQPILNQFWIQINSDLSILPEDRLKRQAKIFQWILTQFQENIATFEEKFVPEVQLGIFKVDCNNIKSIIQPKQKQLVESLEKILLQIYVSKGQQIVQWLQDNITGLRGIALNIEEYVQKKAFLDQTTQQFPQKQDQYSILQSIYNLLTEKQVKQVNEKEIQNMSTRLSKLENDLKTEISEVDTKLDSNYTRFKDELKSTIINLKEVSTDLLEKIQDEKYLSYENIKLEDAVQELSSYNEKVKEIEQKVEQYTQYEEILQVQEFSNFDQIQDTRQEINLRYDMWRGIQEFTQLQNKWNKLPFTQINANEIEQITEKYYKIVNKCQKNLPKNTVIQKLSVPVLDVKNAMPVVKALRSDNLTEKHWDEIKGKDILNAEFDIDDIEFTLEKMISLKVGDYMEQITEISARAAQEFYLSSELEIMEQEWEKVIVIMKQYKDRQDLYVLSEVDELIQKFDEGLANMNGLLANRFIGPLRPKAQKIQSELLLLQDIIDKWVECQKKWMYLENIFASPDIIRSLPQEAQMFTQCDKTLKQLMKKMENNPKIMNLIKKTQNLFQSLCKTSDLLDKIEKQLEEYLETKRQAFPRFYFLSNDELLEILAKASHLHEIEPQLGKCFEGLVKLYMGNKENTTKNSILIQGMISPEGEVCQFINKTVKAQGNVEIWLDQLQKDMNECIKKLIKQGFNNSSSDKYKSRLDWIFDHAGQVVSVVNQIIWSSITEETIKNNDGDGDSLEEHLNSSITQLNTLTNSVRGELSSKQRKIIVALITQDVHNRDIVNKLYEEGVCQLQDFIWQQQLRYSFSDEDCVIRQVTSQLPYGNEYLGITSRLVITPLTDRCWITITSALSNQLGANPAGPAGTGKTESTKDLAKGLGILCIVFNCSDQITAAMMNKLFSGLCQQGAWTCLDEFNRIDIEVLSVIAQQLLVVRMALVQKLDQFELEGQTIPLKQGYGCFITMNPGYAGRTELPDNLKALFRPVAMMIPDYSMIAEIMLFAEGFQEATDLSKKMVQLYKLSSEQLSQQDHYDFGMRALKSLLVMAGQLKRSDIKLQEEVVLIRAMRDANIPKFLRDDLPLFSALVQDLFPSVEIPEVSYGEIESQIKIELRKNKLQVKPEYVTKVIQLFDTLNVRFGVMLVGPSGTGKTECFQNLANVMNSLKLKQLELEKQNEAIKDPKMKHIINEKYQFVNFQPLNPKSITMGELYGEVDVFTQEWVDGLASSIIRNVNNISVEPSFDLKKKEWVVFDGPVDALWIENMNTVLDDNQTLCLANSERIKLRDSLRMLFEVQDLAVASPATVSRCGMVYLCHEDLGWQPFLNSWFEKNCTEDLEAVEQQNLLYLTQEQVDILKNMFYNLYEPTIRKIKKMYEPFPTTSIQQVQSICNFLQILLKKMTQDDYKKKLHHIFAYSMIWGATSGIDSQHYDDLSNIFRDIFQALRFPKSETIFDFYFDNGKNCFLDWSEALDANPFTYTKGANYFDLLVPTVDTVKYSSVLENLLSIQKPCLFTGGTGVGKSVIIQNLLLKLKEKNGNVNSVLLNFSAQTKSKQTQLAIEGKLHKKGKTLFGARPNEQNVIFIDDINMPSLEEYGAQPCVELLRQFLDKKGFYDRQKLFWKHIEDTTLICAGAPPGGGRNILTPRFIRHFNVFCLPQPSDTTLYKIFKCICEEFMKAYAFQSTVQNKIDASVSGTIEIFKQISKDLLPIPSKFHYTFNLRDISKVFQGILMIKPKECSNPESFIKLWIHEVSRVFQDRLVNEQDNEWFKDQIVTIVSRNFAMSMTKEDIFDTPIVFSDILKLEFGKIYEEVKDLNKLKDAIENKQDDYNMENDDKLDLVFFQQAQQHILRIARVLRQPRGNAMLIGVGGSGKQSLSKLASFIMESKIFQIELIKNYNSQSFRDDLILIMKQAGVEMQVTTFIFTDVQIAYESFLEDINNLLNTGEVPNLFAKKEDYDEIINGVREKLKINESPDQLWNLFVESVRQNLHIILCMSPVGSALRIRTRKFPSMIDCCTLDWFSQWPEEALYSVALKFLDNIELPNEQMKDNLAKLCMQVNVDVAKTCENFYAELKRRVYITPKSYLDHISLFQKLLEDKRADVLGFKQKLSDGLDKLKSTTEEVASLEAEMITLQPLLEEQGKKTEQALLIVNKDSKEANEKEKQVSEEAAKVNEEAEEIKEINDEAEQELAIALPALKQAEDALKTINKQDISQVRGFQNPPGGVQMTLEAVCALLGEKQDWATAKLVMQDMNFIKKLETYDKDNIPERYLNKLRVYTKKPEFEPFTIGKISGACKGLCLWCHAMDKYAQIAKTVEPKKKKVKEMQAKLDIKYKELALKQEKLNEVKEKVAILQKNCDETMAKKQQLENDIQKTKNRLVAAEKLTTLLADEGVRWQEQIKQINGAIEELIGNIFMASSTMSYCGPFTIKYRESLENNWKLTLVDKLIPISENYNISDTLETPINIRDWILKGLPNDQFSVDNAVITKKAQRWPLMIDPQGEANKWIKNQESENELKICRFTDPHYLKTLQNSVSSGYPVLIEELTEYLDPAIESVLQKQIIVQDGRKLIKVGDKKVDYDPRFQLYMTSKMSNPHYLPEIFIKVTVINFSITFEGLQDQLLGEVMKNEKPEIEEQRDETIVTIAEGKKTLKTAQDKILQLLADAEGMILDDEELIKTLEESKFRSGEITQKLEETEIIEKQINDNRNLYLPIAIRGTILYFVISDLSGIDPMYQFSLQYFKKLFRIAMQTCEDDENLSERLLKLNNNITKVIFIDICRGLFESHKKLFAFLINTSIERQAGIIKPSVWNLLIRGPGIQSAEFNIKIENPDPQQITKQTWFYISMIGETVEFLQNVPKLISQNLAKWVTWWESIDIFTEPLPFDLEQQKNYLPIYKLLLIKAVQSQKTMESFQNYVSKQMGSFYDTIPSTTMEQIYNDSGFDTPIIFILSQGADPTQMLINLSKLKDKDITPNVISLGQGQGIKAEALLEKSKKSGAWVLLQNCHLCKSWMPQLEKIVEQFSKPGYIENDEFRLFLTSMPVDYFPVSVLQNGIKLTTEAPRGLKANLLRSVQNLDQEYLDSTSYKKDKWCRMLFGLTFFHAIIQERRKFGPLGFNIRYEFNDSDIAISKSTLKMFINTPEEEEIPYDAMIYMTGHINYGGRVTDDWDRVCLLSILKSFYSPEALEPNYKFSESGNYYAPQTNSLEEFTKYIQQLPNFDQPEVFGMHENANTTFQQQESDKLIETILSIQPRDSAAGGEEKSSDQIVTEIAQRLASELPDYLDRDLGLQDLFILTEVGAYQSLTTVLLQEIEKFNRLLKVCKTSLEQLQKAIKGFILMSQDLDDMYLAFIINQLPPIWKKVSYASLKPLSSWYQDLLQRILVMRNWLTNGNPNSYWLSGFFFPQGFLTGVLQTHSRKNKEPIDKLSFRFKILDHEFQNKIFSSPPSGVYVHGLYCDGGRWNDKQNCIEDQQIGQLYSNMPTIHFIPEKDYEIPEENYVCPIYKTSNRVGMLSTTGQSTNFILGIGIPTKVRPEFWTLRGTALLCQLNY